MYNRDCFECARIFRKLKMRTDSIIKSLPRRQERFRKINTLMIARRISPVNPVDNYVESYAGTKLSLPLMRHIPDSADCLRDREKEKEREDERENADG